MSKTKELFGCRSKKSAHENTGQTRSLCRASVPCPSDSLYQTKKWRSRKNDVPSTLNEFEKKNIHTFESTLREKGGGSFWYCLQKT